jgi:hypothetical protein
MRQQSNVTSPPGHDSPAQGTTALTGNTPPNPQHLLAFPSRGEAEAAVRALEHSLRDQLRSVHPEELIPLAALRMRESTESPRVSSYYPPYVMVHLIEACCAYWQQWRYVPLNEDRLRESINTLSSFNDPTILNCLKPESDLFEFMLYMHRTQLDMQGEVWWMPVGRFTRLFGEAGIVPVTNARFLARYGLTIREWIKLTFAVHAATAGRPLMANEYALKLPELGLDSARVGAFLRETSSSIPDVGQRYRAIREGTAASPPAPVLTWMQRKPQLADKPLIKLARGYVAPVEAYFADLFGDILFRRIAATTEPQDRCDPHSPRTDPVRQEIGRRFEVYTETLIRHHLPNLHLWTADHLEIQDEGRSCDFALELPDSLLLIECKAVTFEREVVTRKAVLDSPAITRIIDGYEQLIWTAGRIVDGSYRKAGLEPTKPRYGIVVTLGEVPGANYPTVWNHAQAELSKNGTIAEPVPQLLIHHPQAFHGYALEHLVLCLRAGIAALPSLFEERASKSHLAIGDWGMELNRKCVAAGKQDLGFWRTPGERLLEELRVPSSFGS